MDSLFYIYLKIIKNKFKKALKRPVFYLCALGAIAYISMLAVFLLKVIPQLGIDKPIYFVLLVSASTLYLEPTSFIAFAKRKGLLFYPSDIHFIFPSPIHPKLVLLYAYSKQLCVNFIVSIAIFLIGIISFHIPFSTMLLYFLFTLSMGNLLEGSLVVFLYGNERFSQTFLRNLARILWLFVGALVVVGILLIKTQGFSLAIFEEYLSSPLLQWIPIFGWNVAIIRLILIGPTLVNVICSILYIVTVLTLFVFAYRMNCTGEYYEYAMKFADDYQEVKTKKSKGETAFLGKKTQYKVAHINYVGNGAKAIFYRQLLEYKKNRFFIFGMPSVLSLGGGLLIVYLLYIGEITATPSFKYYIAPLLMMYLNLIFTGYQTKWAKELENPYTFLIPDTPIRKLWYATIIEHVRGAFNGLLAATPIVIILRLPLWYIPLYIILNVAIQATKLYSETVCEVLLGNTLGKTIKTLLRTLITWAIIGIVVPICMLGTLVYNGALGLTFATLYLLLMAILLAYVGASVFERMEMIGE
ncbi:MAG: putative ABC exporter domain-containing protein [Lachnospiraceae bacterium]